MVVTKKRKFVDAAISFSHLRKLKEKCTQLASLALGKVESPLKTRRAIAEHRKKVKSVKSSIDTSIETVSSKWTSITGAGSNDYVASRIERDDIIEKACSSIPKNVVSPTPTKPRPKAKIKPTIEKNETPPHQGPSNGKEYTPASAVRIIMEH